MKNRKIIKFPIKWHEDCFINSTATLNRKKLELQKLITNVAEHELDLDFYAKQITTAKNKGVIEFDRDRYLKSLKGIS